jgi:FMN-dependent NADH-azoreductase
MPILPRIDSSPMGERSISRKLTEEFAKTWIKSHPNGSVVSRDLTTTDIPVIDGGWVAAAYTPEDARTAEQKETLRVSDMLIADLQKANEYVVGVPMHNFSIPSTLKLWIDQVMRGGQNVRVLVERSKRVADGQESDVADGQRRSV